MKKTTLVLTLAMMAVAMVSASCAKPKQAAKMRGVEAEPDMPVSIPDHNLAALIRRAINKTDGDLYVADLATGLTELNGRKRGIIDISGLEYCVGLKKLDLGGNYIRDAGPLAELINLEELDLSENYLSDISALSGLVKMKALRIERNEISDISPLCGMKRLNILDISENHVQDISCLSEMTALWELHIDSNSISDIMPLLDNSDAGGLDEGDLIFISNNPLDRDSVFVAIPGLEAKGVVIQN